MKKLNPNLFIIEINRTTSLENLECHGALQLNDKNLNKKALRFIKCKFQFLEISKINDLESIHFYECETTDILINEVVGNFSFIFHNCTNQSIQISGSDVISISIKNCENRFGKILIEGNTIHRIYLENIDVLKINITHSNVRALIDIISTKCERLEIKNCEKIGQLKLFKIYPRIQFTIKKCNIENKFYSQLSVFNSINIDSCEFNSAFDWKSNPIRLVQLTENTFNKPFNLELKLNQDESQRDFGVTQTGIIEDFSLKNNIFGSEGFLNLSGNELIKFYCKFNVQSKTQFSCHLPKTNTIRFIGEISNSTYNFSFFEIIELTISEFYNYSHLNLSSINNVIFKIKGEKQPKRSLSLRNSFLGKTNFNNCDLSTFDDIVIADSQLQEITTSNVTWFNKMTIETRNEIGFLENRNYREVYRQLKIAMEKQGDRIKYLDFKSKELSAYKDLIAKDKRITWDEKVIFWIGKNTNNFGQDWLKAVKIMGWSNVVFLLILSALITKTINPVEVCYFFWSNIKHLFTLLNPAHSLKDIVPVHAQTFWMNAVDYLSKIWNAFFIFQIISAFRKYFK